jgi:hypothetical protein
MIAISSDNIFPLDIRNNGEIISYEKSLYRAFSNSLTNTSHLIFTINHKEKRLSTKIPYDFQEIYVYKWSDAIVSGFAINFNMKETLQLEMLNFHVDSRDNACEALSIFSLLDFIKSMSVLKIMAGYLMTRLKEKNISVIYATSSKKKAVAYRQLGFMIIDQYDFEGQGKCLLKLAV